MVGTRTHHNRPDALDSALIVLFLIGIYLEFALAITGRVRMPAAPSGVAGLLLLIRHYRWIDERQVLALSTVIGLYLLSTLCVPNSVYFGERLKGFLQISYSLVIGYGLFITLLRYDRARLARIFLIFCVVIVIGCALEKYTGFAAVSDAVRNRLFDPGVIYDANLRDQLLYGGVRPKFFSSEPSYVAYALTLYAFAWYVLSTSRWKLVGYIAILGAGVILIRSPTLILGCTLIALYEFLIAGRSLFGRVSSAEARLAKLILLSTMVVVALGFLALRFFDERMNQIASSNDGSFFFRVIGPALMGFDTFVNRPFAGAGLSGEESIASRIAQIYYGSSGFSERWEFDKITRTMTNFFWLHWVYLGLGFGVILLVALSRLLRTMQVPSLLFCWGTWAIMGQSSGAYVSPKPWATLMIVAAASVLHYREPAAVLHKVRRPTAMAPPVRLEPRLSREGLAR